MLSTALIALLVAAGACLYLGRRLASLQAETAAVRRRADLVEARFAAATLGSFDLSDKAAGASPGLVAGLDLGAATVGDTAPGSLEAVLALFADSDRQSLADAIETLEREGEGFRLVLKPKQGPDAVSVSGACFDGPGGAEDRSAFLWFQDLGEEVTRFERAEAERSLREALLDTLPVPVWLRDQTLKLSYCNAAYAGAVDRERETAVADSIELLDQAQGAPGQDLARKAREAGAAVTASHHAVIGGARRWMAVEERPFGADGLVGLAIDRTDSEELKTELSRHIDAHSEVLDNLASGIAIFGQDMRLKFYNGAYARMFHLDEDFLATEPHLNDVHEALRERRQIPESADFPKFKKERLRAFQTLIAPLEELQHLPDGSTIRTVVAPHPFGGVLSICEDVTDRLALERSYNTLIAVRQETLDNLFEGVAVFGSDGRLKLHNPAYARIWELPAESLQNEPHVRDLLPQLRRFYPIKDKSWPEAAERMAVQVTEAEPRGGRFERGDGTVLDWSQVPLPDGASLFTYFDVTDSTRVERALRERAEALETTDRLKSEFIANVSYELRTPLNAIIGFAEILEKQLFGELNDRQLDYARAIVESSERLISLINDILDLATIEAGYLQLELESIDIRELLNSIFTLGHERARSRGLELALDCEEDVGAVVADPRRLKQALFNLLSNAFKFTPEGGSVTVSAVRDNGELLLSVADTGVGIPVEEHGRVFDKFIRGPGNPRQAGAGLGLSLVRSLIELHGGQVELVSEPDRGTKVTCRIPVERTLQAVEPPADARQA
ncbi:MAG: PAS-domain containing protein [Kiloniellales bacterium]|nr:PAS-domain containing protein [Kiloniellales bacterium]